MTLRVKLTLGFLLVGSICAVVGLIGWRGVNGIESLLTKTERTQDVAKTFLQREIDHLNWTRKVGEFQRDENMVHLAVEKDPHKCGFGQWYYGEGRHEAETAMPELKPLLDKMEQPHMRLHASAVELEKILAEGKSARPQAVNYYKTETTAVLSEVQKIFGELRPKIEDQAKANQESAAVGGKSIRHMTLAATGAGLLIALGLGLFASWRLSGSMLRVATQISEGVTQTISAADHVGASSQSLAEGANEQAASIEETCASLEEMSSMTKHNAENSQKANELARQTRAAADKGATDMQAMSGAMAEIKTASDDIAKIIKTIDEIAFQTNILALNAAVEAARAGEAGMGFAVVANEVRNLAQRSANAAKETAAKIEGAIAKTAQGVGLSAKVAEALNEIVAKARQMDELAAGVANASSEQSQGIAQVNIAMEQMDKVTQSNATNAEECAAAAEELHAQAETMQESVLHLMQLVGGGSHAETPAISKPAARLAKVLARTPTTDNGNGHSAKLELASPKLAARQQGQIPMEGDFKDF